MLYFIINEQSFLSYSLTIQIDIQFIMTKSSFLKRLQRIIFERSHLALYLPILAENKQAKIIRLLNDKSNINFEDDDEQSKDSHWNNHGANKISFVQKVLFNRLPILHPCSNLLLGWYGFVFTAIMYYFIEVGIMLTFGLVAWQSELSSVASIILDIFFILILIVDVFVQLNTGYLFRGMIILERERVIGRYLHGYFWIDLFNILILIIALASGNYFMNIPKLIIILKFSRIFEFDDYFQRRLNIHRILKTLYIIGKQIVIIFILSHIIGLIFYAIDYAILNSNIYSPTEVLTLCWLNSSTAYSPIISYGWPIQYFYALYWGVNTITTISYGDIAPNNPIETVYATLMFCFGFVVYGYVVNQIIKVILWARTVKDQYRAELIVMDTYMNNMKINKETKQQVRNYLEFLHMEEKNRNMTLEAEMKAKLPEDLRYELVKSAYSMLNDKLESIFETNFSTRFLFYLEEKKYTSNQLVFRQGLDIDRILYLNKGQVRLQCAHGLANSTTIYKTKTINQFIAHYQHFLSQKLPYNIYSESGSVFYSILGSKILEECSKNLEMKEKYQVLIYALRHQHKLSIIFHRCYFCHQEHLWHKCDNFFPNFSNIRLIKMTQAEKKQEEICCREEKIIHKTWKQAKKLDELKMIKEINESSVLGKIQKRLNKIRQKIRQKNRSLEVDMAYDWKHYLPLENLSKIKDQWNQKKLQNSKPEQKIF